MFFVPMVFWQKIFLSLFFAMQLVSSFFLLAFFLEILFPKENIYTCDFVVGWSKWLFFPIMGFALGSIGFFYEKKIMFSDEIDYKTDFSFLLGLLFIVLAYLGFVYLIIYRFSGCSSD